MLQFVFAAAAAQAAANPSSQIPAQPALAEQIVLADAAFISLYFGGSCDLPRLRSMLAEGAEFYHQKHGIAPAERFVGHYLEDCKKREAPNAAQVRREIVPGSLSVNPIGSAAAFQTAQLNFYAKRGADAERLVGREKVAQLWILGTDGKWRLSRSFSYDLQRSNN